MAAMSNLNMFDVIQPKEIESFLADHAGGDSDLAHRLNCVLYRMILCQPVLGMPARHYRDFKAVEPHPTDVGWLASKFNKGLPVFRFDPSSHLKAEVNLVAYWLKQAAENQIPWARNEDRLRRRSGLETISALIHKVHDDLKKWNCFFKYYAHTQNFKVVHEFDNGFVVVEILSSAEMNRESDKNGICVAKAGYSHIDAFNSKEARYFSLRSPFNEPHATIN